MYIRGGIDIYLAFQKKKFSKKHVFMISEKIDKIEFWAIIKYLYQKGVRNKKFCENIAGTFYDDYPSYNNNIAWEALKIHGMVANLSPFLIILG